MKKVHGSDNCKDTGKSTGTQKHQRFSSQFIDSKHADKSENQVYTACDHYIKKYIRYSITCISKDLLGIIKDHINSAPLLENCNIDTKDQDFTNTWLTEKGKTGLIGF